MQNSLSTNSISASSSITPPLTTIHNHQQTTHQQQLSSGNNNNQNNNNNGIFLTGLNDKIAAAQITTSLSSSNINLNDGK
jgi:hypothetical protein